MEMGSALSHTRVRCLLLDGADDGLRCVFDDDVRLVQHVELIAGHEQSEGTQPEREIVSANA